MPEEIDYRSLTEVQLKYELKKLERRILKITGDPIVPKHRKFFEWARNDVAVERVKEMMSTRSYILSLLFEKHCTPAEVARLEKAFRWKPSSFSAAATTSRRRPMRPWPKWV